MEGKVDLGDVVYLSAEEEEGKLIAQANIPLSAEGQIETDKVIVRDEGDFPLVDPIQVDYTDVAPNQIASISASLFLSWSMMMRTVPLWDLT